MASLYTVGATLSANPTRFVRGFQRASAGAAVRVPALHFPGRPRREPLCFLPVPENPQQAE